MKLIFAQGNPDTKFSQTRHNVGFAVLDTLAASLEAKWTPKVKFRADIAEVIISGEKVLLIKPTTYYNETGISARALVDFYSLDSLTDVLVIHDDLALPFGTIRTRAQGSDAGNNGIKSLNSHLGPDYHRVRVGIWNDLRDRMEDAEFVLSKFSKNESETLTSDIIPHIINDIEQFCAGTFETTSRKL